MLADNFTDNLIVCFVCFSEFQHITECMYSNGYQCASPMANQVASKYTNYTSQITNFTPVLKIQLVHVYINISDCICQKHAMWVGVGWVGWVGRVGWGEYDIHFEFDVFWICFGEFTQI